MGILRQRVVQLLGAAAFVHRAGRAVEPRPFGEPDRAGCQTRYAVHRLGDGRGENVVAEHELFGRLVRLVRFGIVVVHRAAHADTRVVILAGRIIDIGCQRVAQADGVAHEEHMVGEAPDAAFDARVFGRMGFEDRSEYAVLQPARVKFRIGRLLRLMEHVAADVVAPPAVVDVRSRSREVGQVGEHGPCGVGIARKCQRIAVAAQPAPAVVDEGAQFGILTLRMVEEGMVEPEGVRQSGGVFRLFPLLPVEPPEVHAVAFHRFEYGFEIGVGPFPFVDFERYALAFLRPSVFLGKVVVYSFVRLDT